jgi:hypothetical protein
MSKLWLNTSTCKNGKKIFTTWSVKEAEGSRLRFVGSRVRQEELPVVGDQHVVRAAARGLLPKHRRVILSKFAVVQLHHAPLLHVRGSTLLLAETCEQCRGLPKVGFQMRLSVAIYFLLLFISMRTYFWFIYFGLCFYSLCFKTTLPLIHPSISFTSDKPPPLHGCRDEASGVGNKSTDLPMILIGFFCNKCNKL